MNIFGTGLVLVVPDKLKNNYMKRILLPFIALVCLTGAAMAQQTTNLVVFAEQGERFTVVLNGLRINDQPETNVKVSDLNTEYYKIKIVFDDAKIPDMDKTVMLKFGSEVTYNIKKNNKGEYVLRWLSETPIAQVPPPPPTQRVIVYNQVPPNDGIVIRGGITTTTTTTTTTTGGTNVVGATVDVGGVGMNVVITDNTGGMTTGTTTTTYSTTTTTTTTGGTTGQVITEGCVYPMTSGDFNSAKGSISSKSFEDSKLTTAKQIVDANCLTSQQVKEIMGLFSFEESKLDFAKYAYNKVTDPNNYYKINDAFTFESSISELDSYIKSNPRRTTTTTTEDGW